MSLKSKEIFLTLLFIYTFLILFLYFMQERLIFLGAYSFKSLVKESEYITKEVKEFTLTTNDKIKLSGAIFQNQSETLLIYFGGNGENSTYFINLLSSEIKTDMVTLNYRGYGKSEGEPSEDKLFLDSLTIYDNFKDRYKNIIVIAKSLGSGVATYLASKQKVSGAILITPYDSIAQIAKDFYPIFPIELLLKHKFDSISHLKEINSPISILIAENDEVIPNKNSINLKNSVQNLALFEILKDTSHNEIIYHERFMGFINDSINQYISGTKTNP